MARPSKTDQELGWLEDAWKIFRSLEASYQGVISIYANPMGRPGVFTFRFVFTPLVETSENYLGSCAVQFLYPNADSKTLAATFYNQAHKLAEVAESSNRVRGPYRKNGA